MLLINEIVKVSWLNSILLGILQGLTEFLPVSSTAHMAIAPQLLGQPDPGAAFSAIVQLGPIIAIIAYFWKDLLKYVKGVIRTKSPKNIPPGDLDAKIGWFVVFASLPGMVFGLLLHKFVEGPARELHLVAIGLIVFAIALFVAERIGKRNVSLDNMTLQQSQAIGWTQILALIPGVSRSGSTITAGLFMGLDRESSARFSFLLGIPFITSAGLYKLYTTLRDARKIEGGMSQLFHAVGPYLLGAAVAGVFAYIVVKWFMGYMKENNTMVFIIYRIVLGIALLILLQMGLIKNVVKTDDKAIESKPAASIFSPVPSPSGNALTTTLTQTSRPGR